MDDELGSHTRPLRNQRFELRGVLGATSASVVYRAFDRASRVEVALKRLRTALPDPDEVFRLKREFRQLRDIKHPNLVVLHDLEVSDDDCFYTMELIHGVNFLEFVRGGDGPSRATPMSEAAHPRLRQALKELVLGVSVLHAAGKIHRDIKPGNVLVEPSGRVVLLDFGLVIGTDPLRSQETMQGTMTGTFDYMAPEQAWGLAPSAAADWYAVGIMLYEALTGCLPFAGSLADVLQDKGRGIARGPARLAPWIPPALDSTVIGLLDPDPSRRARPSDLLSALDVELPRIQIDGAAREGFVGREAEIARLECVVGGGVPESPVVVHLRGPSGIGKTELLQRLLDRLESDPGTLVLDGRCHLRESVPYKAIDPLMDGLSHRLRELPDETVTALAPRRTGALLRIAPVLGRVPGLARVPTGPVAAEPQELRRQGFLAVRELFARLDERYRIVLCIDDAQWGDRDSARLIRELLRPPDAPRLLLLLSYRAEDAADAPFLAEFATGGDGELKEEWLDLGPLDRDAVRALGRLLLGRDPSEHELRALVEESAGSPFFVGEMARFLAVRDRLPEKRGGPTMANVIAARLSALPGDSRQLLELVATAGGPVSTDVVLDAAGSGLDARHHVRDLCDASLLRVCASRDDGLIETYHDRIRVAVLSMFDDVTRRERHRQLATTLEKQPQTDPYRLVEHYLGAGEEEHAAEYALGAAEAATGALAFDRAADLYELAARLRDRGDADWRLQVLRAEALANAGRGAQAAGCYEGAAAAVERAHLERNLGRDLRSRAAAQYLYGGCLPQGTALLRDVLRDLGVSVPQTTAATRRAALGLRLGFFMRGPRFRLRERAQVPPDVLLRLDALWGATKGTVMLDFGLCDFLAARHLREALRAGDRTHLVYALSMEAAVEANIGGGWLRRRAQKLLALADELSGPDADALTRGWVVGSRGVAAYHCAEWRRCVELTTQAIGIYREGTTGTAWNEAACQTFRLAALVHLGRIREASAVLPALLDDARSRDDLHALAIVRTGHTVLVPLARDDPEGALRAAEEMLLPFTTDHFTSQHYHHLIATIQAFLYAGDGWNAWRRVCDGWSGLRAVGFLIIDALAIELRRLRALAALAAAAAGPPPAGLVSWTPKRLEDVARQEMRRIRRSGLAHAAPFVDSVHAALAGRRGDVATERAALVASIEGFERADMALHREAARLRLAAIDGNAGDHASSRAWMEAEGVRNPRAMAGMLVPGLTADPAEHVARVGSSHEASVASS